jgi:hypothetical protein
LQADLPWIRGTAMPAAAIVGFARDGLLRRSRDGHEQRGENKTEEQNQPGSHLSSLLFVKACEDIDETGDQKGFWASLQLREVSVRDGTTTVRAPLETLCERTKIGSLKRHALGCP